MLDHIRQAIKSGKVNLATGKGVPQMPEEAPFAAPTIGHAAPQPKPSLKSKIGPKPNQHQQARPPLGFNKPSASVKKPPIGLPEKQENCRRGQRIRFNWLDPKQIRNMQSHLVVKTAANASHSA